MQDNNSTLLKLKKLNPSINIESVFDKTFNPFGQILNLNCSSKLLSKLEKDTDIPEVGNIYKPFIREWEDEEIVNELSQYYDKKIEIGYCNGQNTKLNALEWHDCPEINIYSRDVVLFLSTLDNLDNSFSLNSKSVKTFFVPKNTAILLYNTTLHFAPCKVDKDGFKAIIILEDQTNTEIEDNSTLFNTGNPFNSLIFKKNKYIICHQDATNLTNQNVKANIKGINLNLNI